MMAKAATTLSIPEQIRKHIVGRGLKYIWVANQSGISQEHLSNILADRVLLTDDVLGRINNTLGTDFKKS